jgi:hypothetical protein
MATEVCPVATAKSLTGAAGSTEPVTGGCLTGGWECQAALQAEEVALWLTAIR